ncbi:1-(5-phosphoribosyl)-5-[(5-phosphoribosylamino)methylideneamino]imidazole-4-carboxamide isomerase [bacterium]|nr:1-(5-phosphoribosyl)-5-[(5-phosphoribosylamino)methylideneamino]imidazole-4-carboxamide isomerase [bacterium]
MLIIPAIDLIDGKCVRLDQGKADKKTVYSNNPSDIAENFSFAGAKRLHVVDLDGAFKGSPENIKALSAIRKNFKGIIEFGGGIRTFGDIEKILSAGADRIILGTMAYKSHDFVKECINKYGDIFIVGIDAKNGYVAVKGWVETTKIKAVDLACDMEFLGIKKIIFTDIARDGMLKGPNIESLKKMLKSVSIKIISSGGISKIDDIRKIAELKHPAVEGIIIGKALYTGAIDINEVIKCWQNE